MNALKPRPPFQVLIMSEESRLGREAIETAYALKQLVHGGRARVLLPRGPRAHARLPDRQDHAVADGVRRRTRAREGAAAHVRRDAAEGAGRPRHRRPRVRVRQRPMVLGADGQARRSHVERRINERGGGRSSDFRADGARRRPKTRITKALNDEGAPAPRPQQGRPRAGRRPPSARCCTGRSTAARSSGTRPGSAIRWGQQQQAARPEQDWIRHTAPALRIVLEELWSAAHNRLDHSRARHLRHTNGQLWGRPRSVESRYLLPGFARCAVCGGVMHVRTRDHGSVGRRSTAAPRSGNAARRCAPTASRCRWTSRMALCSMPSRAKCLTPTSSKRSSLARPRRP